MVAEVKTLNLGKHWALGGDGDLNVILYERKYSVSKKTGETYTRLRVFGYYATPGNALRALVDQEVSRGDLADLKALCDRIERVKREIVAALQNSAVSALAQGTLNFECDPDVTDTCVPRENKGVVVNAN